MKPLCLFAVLNLILSPSHFVSAQDETQLAAGVEAFQREDYRTAFQKLEPLAERGDGHAQYFLGRMLEEGKGVAVNVVRAHAMYNLSASKSHPHQKDAQVARESLEQGMTPEQIESAQDLATSDLTQGLPSASRVAEQNRAICQTIFNAVRLIADDRVTTLSTSGEKNALGAVTDDISFDIGVEKAYVFVDRIEEGGEQRFEINVLFPRLDDVNLQGLVEDCALLEYADGWKAQVAGAEYFPFGAFFDGATVVGIHVGLEKRIFVDGKYVGGAILGILK